jgi:hypothetical protein
MHTTEIVRTEQKSDEAIAVVIRCCNNPLTDSAHTLYGVAKMTPEQLGAAIDRHHDRVAAKCAGMSTGKNLLANVVAKTKTHTEVK